MLVLPTLLICLTGAGVRIVEAITTTNEMLESTLSTTLGELAAETSPSAELTEAETKDPQRVEIIKQLRKVNQDGSYTVGYEAEDGTFKIESRDVLGNVKGTYGYIDVNGDIKRVSYGGAGQPTRASPHSTTAAPSPASTTTTTEADVVHIPPRFNRSQQQQLLLPTTRRPPNYQTSPHHLMSAHLMSQNPQHASTLRPSVIQTIPRKRTSHPSTAASTTSTSATTTARAGSSTLGLPRYTTPSTTAARATMSPVGAGHEEQPATATMATPKPTTETGGSLAGSFAEPTTASSRPTPLHNKPQSTVLVIRPTLLPYQSSKVVEQLMRPERLEGKQLAKKPVRGNFLRRQLATPPSAVESSEEYEAQQQQQIVYGQSDGHLANLYPGKPLYTTHPAPRIPASVLAARQRAAQIQSALQAQAGQNGGTPAGERLGKERIYVKQPARPLLPAVQHEPSAQILYELSTAPSLERGFATGGRPGPEVQQATSGEIESDVDERPPIFRPRPKEYRPHEAAPQGRYRTPYGLPPPFERSFTSIPPPPQELPYPGRVAESAADHGKHEPNDAQQQYQNHQPSVIPYRQQRRLTGNLPLAPVDSGYAAPQQHQAQQQQQQQNSLPIPVPFNPAQYGGRLPSANPYYYDIPPERPLTARDFERILQLLIFRHHHLQQANQRYRGGGGYYNGYNGGFPYNPYFPDPSPAPYGLGGPFGGGGGYPQQQIPRPPLPYPYVSPYEALGYQRSFYSPSSPSANVQPEQDGAHSDADAGYGLPTAGRRSGQYFRDGSAAGSGDESKLRAGASDYLPPDVRESLLYRMLMLAIQTSGSNMVFPSPTGPSLSQLSHVHHLQRASSVPQPQIQPTHRAPSQPTQERAVTAASVTDATLPMFSKKPVRSVQILGEE